jgi:hypothetical protein
MGVRQLVTDHNQGSFALFSGFGKNVLYLGVLTDGGFCNHALMGMGAGHFVQLPAVYIYHHGSAFLCFRCDMTHDRVSFALKDVHLVQGDSCTQGFYHSVAALDSAVCFGFLLSAVVPLFIIAAVSLISAGGTGFIVLIFTHSYNALCFL